jgi:hypothetical protein
VTARSQAHPPARWLYLLAAAPLLVAALALGGCGDGDDDDDDDDEIYQRVGRIAGTAELATYAYAASGAEGLYDYMADSVTERCTLEEVEAQLAAEDRPVNFGGFDGAHIDGETARVQLVLVYDDGDREVEWTFIETQGEFWRIIDVPGLGECAG